MGSPAALEEAETVEEAMRSAVLGAVRSLTAWLAPLFFAFAPADYYLSPQPAATELALLDVLFGVTFAYAYWMLRTGKVENRHANTAAGVLVLAVLPYTMANLWLAQWPVFSGGFVLWIMGIALVILSWRWLAACLAIGLASWILVASSLPPSPDWGQWGFIVVSATAISLAAHGARIRTVRHLQTLRVEERTRHADVERARAAREEATALRRVNELKTEFMNHAAHELATPLTPLILEVSLLKREGRAPAERRRSVDAIERNVDRLRALVDDLLDSAKLESGRMALDARPVDFTKAVQEILEEYEEAAAQRGIRVESEVDPRLEVVGDRRRLQQVVANFLSNALKFTPKGGTVKVAATAISGAVRVSVQDSGRGIAAGDRGRLFHPFVQLNDPAQGGLRGSGLGLYISRGIVENHGGTIGVDSPGPGRGSTFWFTVPKTVTS